MVAEKIARLFCELYPASLSVTERWQAARNWEHARPSQNPLIFLGGMIAIAILTVLLFIVRSRNIRQQSEKIVDDFNDTADRYGLSTIERRLTMTVARLAGMNEVNLIFTSSEAFGRGAAKLMQERFLAGDSIEERRVLKNAIASTYNKLGFQHSRPTGKGLSSRHVPAGKAVMVTRRRDGSAPVQATVIENDEVGLTIDTGFEVAAEPGQIWLVKYLFGVSTWEFESPVIACSDGKVTLAHCERVRFTNRRRFLRVPVRGKAFVARYPFQTSEEMAALPQWSEATVTEIAGPGLKLETRMSVEVGERLLVVVNIEGGGTIRDVAEIRHIIEGESGSGMAVELVTLGDAEVSALVRLTNMAARRAGMKEQTEETLEPEGSTDRRDETPPNDSIKENREMAAGVEKS